MFRKLRRMYTIRIEEEFPDKIRLAIGGEEIAYKKAINLRYGENPHQPAVLYALARAAPRSLYSGLVEMSEKQIAGFKKTIVKIAGERDALKRENTGLRRDLGILEEEGFIEDASLPPIIIRERPVCSKHGAMLRYGNNIWRCESCPGKPSVDLDELIKFIREEFDGIVVLK